MTRREFIIGTGSGAVVLVASGAWLLDPEQDPLIPGIKYPQPGWFWANRQEPLINGENGPFALIKSTISTEKIFQPIMKQTLPPLLDGANDNHPPLLGEVVRQHLDAARKALVQEYGGQPSTGNVLDVAVISLATIYSPYFYNRDITALFGIPLPNPNSKWLEDKYYRMAHVYPFDPKTWKGTPKQYHDMGLGADRAQHFAYHAAIARISIRHPKAVPNFVRLWAEMGRNTQEKILRQEDLVGKTWELEETLETLPPFGHYNFFTHGIGAPDYGHDLAANHLAASFIANLGDEPSPQKIDQWLNTLNSPLINLPPGNNRHPVLLS